MFKINLNNLCSQSKPEEVVNKHETAVLKSKKNKFFNVKTN